MNETLQILKNRRSVRSYEEKQIADDQLEAILEAGTWAPTGMGQQSPVMVVVQDRETIDYMEALNAAVMGAPGSHPFYGAPTVVVVLADGENYNWLRDGSLVMGNLMNAACSLGVGSCWINRCQEVFDSEEGKALLRKWGLSENYRGVANCILGYAKGGDSRAKGQKSGLYPPGVNIMKSKRSAALLTLVIGILGAFSGLLLVNLFNTHLLMTLSLPVRMIGSIAIYWLIALVPVAAAGCRGLGFRELGFPRERLPRQILWGIAIGVAMSLVLTLVPILAGLGDWVGRGRNYRYLWQYAYDFLYYILAVGLTEELVFRGFAVAAAKELFPTSSGAVILSSVLFGLFHFLGGSWMQMLMTCFIGAIFCICRELLPGCTVLSLAIAHGIYDAMINVWEFAFRSF